MLVRRFLWLALVVPVLAQETPQKGTSDKGEEVVRVSDVDRQPRVLFFPQPQCTDSARTTKLQGTEILNFIVGSEGVPRDIQISGSLGAELDQRVIESVQTWRFEPAQKEGKPVAVRINTEVIFDCGSSRNLLLVNSPKEIDGELVWRVGNGVAAPHVSFAPDPQYDEQARKAKIQGSVLLWLVVAKNGEARDIKVTRSLNPGLDKKAVEAVQSWLFTPASKDGQPVAVEINVDITFKLK